MGFFSKISSLPRIIKQIISLSFDFCSVSIAYWGAFWTRLGDFQFFSNDIIYYLPYLLTLLFTLCLFGQLGLYRVMLRYMNTKALLKIVLGCSLSSISLIFASYYFNVHLPRTIPIIYGGYLVFLCAGVRALTKMIVMHSGKNKKNNVVIYGAGSAGRELAALLDKGDEYHPVCFIDDDSNYYQNSVQGLNVYSPKQIARYIKKHQAKKILLAIPSVSRARRKEIISNLLQYNLEVLSVPSLIDVLNGKFNLDSLKDVDLSELLGRESVSPNTDLMSLHIKNKVVMVTGAGGSIGSELCRQILSLKPSALILFESCEYNLYQIERELSQYKSELMLNSTLIPLLGSVQSLERLTNIMTNFSVNSVYHAAAFKHVPLVEYNVIEGIRNNVFGTYYTAKAAIKAKVRAFVLISTDKAVRPTNIMGATKRLAELALQAFANDISHSSKATCFSMVRFGNVLGSSGSVIPLFKKQIAAGGPVTVTHPEITRYFMTIPEAAQLVIQAGAMAKGGEVFVLDMGKPIKINDLAINLIKLSGLDVKSNLNPYGDIEIEYSGLRPGEKLYEELLIGDDVSNTAHERILMAKESYLTLNEFEQLLAELDFSCRNDDHDKLLKILLKTPTGFSPTDIISDLLWLQKQKFIARNLAKFPDKVNQA